MVKLVVNFLILVGCAQAFSLHAMSASKAVKQYRNIYVGSGIAGGVGYTVSKHLADGNYEKIVSELPEKVLVSGLLAFGVYKTRSCSTYLKGQKLLQQAYFGKPNLKELLKEGLHRNNYDTWVLKKQLQEVVALYKKTLQQEQTWRATLFNAQELNLIKTDIVTLNKELALLEAKRKNKFAK